MKTKGLMSRFFAVMFFIVILMIGSTAAVATADEQSTQPGTVSFIVKLVRGLSVDEQIAVTARCGGVEITSVPVLRLHTVEVPATDLDAVLLNYQSDSQVERVEVNQTRKVEGTPGDPLYADQWALPKIGWDSVFGSVSAFGQATVAILDTGVDALHPDLTGNIIAGTSIIDNSGGTVDLNGHGTSLAGIVAALNNNTGIVGIGFSGVKIMPVTVLSADGTGQDSDIIAGIIYATEHGADIILMGFSNPGFSENLQDAIDYAWSQGIVLVAAVGNDAVSNSTYPAGDRGVIGVSSTDSNDALSLFSNYGTDASNDVFIAAPGENIVTTGLDYVTYPSITGTSASAAIVAGVAGFMKAVDPMLTNGIIAGRLARTADPAGTVDETGNGRVNMARALADTSIDPIEPAGAPGGGPFVGPYKADSVTSVTISSPTHGSPTTITSLPSTFTVSFSYITSSTGTTTGTADIVGSGISASKSLTPGSGSDSISVTIPAGTANGTYNLKVTVTNNAGSGSNNKNDNQNGAVVIDACTAPAITTNPSDQTVTYGAASVSFSAAGSGAPTLTVQWRVSTNGGASYSDITGATNTTFTINSPTVFMSGNKYQAVFTNSCGIQTATSNAATLTINKANVTCTVTPYNVPYDNNTHTATGSCTGVKGEGLSGLDLSHTSHTNAGTYSSDYWNFTDNTGNYNNIGNTTITDTISKADASCAVTGYSVTYDGNAHAASGSCTGVKSESLSGLDLSSTTHTDASTYSNDPWTFIDATGNYNNTSGTVNDVIGKTDASCTISGYTGKYDGAAHRASGSCTGIGGATLSGLDLGASFTNVPGGTAHWTFTNSNYNDRSGDVPITVTKADQTINFGSLLDKTAGDPAFDISATASSGLAVTFSSLTKSVCTVTGNTVTLTNLAGLCTISASQDGDANYNAAPDADQSFNVSPGAAVAFSVGASLSGLPISSVTAGDSFDVTVTARDQYNNTATGYKGTIQFSSNDSKAVLPPDASFDPGDNGSRIFSSVILETAGAHQWVAATDASIKGTTQDINVGPAAANALLVDTPASVVAGTAFDVTVTVKDAYGNTVTNHAGTVHFASSDTNPSVVLPIDYTFTTGTGQDNGVHTFHGTTLITAAESQMITVSDGTITVMSANINVIPGPATKFKVEASKSTVTAFDILDVTVTALDTYDNTATGYSGNVHFTSTDGLADLPADYTFATGASNDNGVHAFTVVFKTGGTQTVTATDIVDSSITGTSDNIKVNKAKATLTLSNLTHTYDGTSKSATVTTTPSGLSIITITYDGATTPPTNAGSYAVVATLDNPSYEADTANGTLAIGKASSTTTVTCSAGPFTYNGTAQTPCTASVAGAGGLSQSLTVNYSDNTNAGNANASANYAGDDNHYGSNDSKNFTIYQAPVTATAGRYSGQYDGNAHSPSSCLATGAYTGDLSCTNNPSSVGPDVSSGEVNPVVSGTGLGNFDITPVKGAYSITQAPSTVTVSCPASAIYNGSAQTPCTAKATGVGMSDVTLTVNYSNNTNAGTATASANWGGDANHTGNTGSGSFAIEQASSTTVVTVSDATYDGNTHGGTANVTGVGGLNQAVTVNYAGRNGTGYGPSTTPPTNAGDYQARATFTGDANHKGSQDSKPFSITKASSMTAVTCSAGPFTYNGSAQTPCTASVTGAGGLIQSLSVSYTNNTNAGTASASATFAGDANHMGSSDLKNFTIDKASSTTSVICPASVTYNGLGQTPCTAKATGIGMSDVDVTASLVYSDNTNAGTATASASWGGDANHTGNSDSKTFTINQATLTVTADNKTKLLNALNPAFTYWYTGYKNGETESVLTAKPTCVSTATQASPVGAYDITCSGGAATNYIFNYVPAKITIIFNWQGFLQPINDTAHQIGVTESRFKLGQTIPVKFVLQNATGAVVQQSGNPTFTRSGNLGPCDTYTTLESTDVATPDSSPVYTWDGSQYHYNWSTKGVTVGEYRIYANLADGTHQWVDICLK